jgi:hypothetical protein
MLLDSDIPKKTKKPKSVSKKMKCLPMLPTREKAKTLTCDPRKKDFLMKWLSIQNLREKVKNTNLQSNKQEEVGGTATAAGTKKKITDKVK